MADRLLTCVREGDTVARLGGDEFAIVLLNATDPAAVDALAERLITVIGANYEVDGHQINIGTSIGIAVAPADGALSHELLKKADTALYQSKANGRGTSCFYEDSMNAALQQRRDIEIGLRRAIVKKEFELYYQPLVESGSRRVTGFEALIRWHHPEHGLTTADIFIPIAELSGLIAAIGAWVLRQACLDAIAWPEAIKVAVNLSPSQFKDKDLVSHVRSALVVSGLAANRLELEITELVLLHDSNSVLDTLGQIKAMGVQIAMDDFGTGYSSLSYLLKFPFDKIKIDQSFVRALPQDQNAIAIVRAVVNLGATFGMTVTAEGVETDEQAQRLELEKCTQMQGFLFSRAVQATSVAALIKQFSPHMAGT